MAVPRSRIAYVWLFSLARGECGEGKRVSMWRKTGPEESGTLKNTDWGHLKNPWHLKEPESHRWESPKTSAFLTTDRQTFMEPGGEERLLPASVPSAYSLWPRTCVVREWSVYEWNRSPRSLNTVMTYLLCACVSGDVQRTAAGLVLTLFFHTCALETDLHCKTWRHMPLHCTPVHLPELLGGCIFGLFVFRSSGF